MHNKEIWDQLLLALKRNDEEAIARGIAAAYRAEWADLVRFAHSCAASHNAQLVSGTVLDPEDVVQEAFAVFLRSAKSIRDNPRAWLYETIRRMFLYRVVRARREDETKQEAKRELKRQARGSKSRFGFTREQRVAAREAVNKLPSGMRQVVIGLYYRGDSVKELATKLGVRENSITKMKGRALKKLQDLI